MTGSKPSGRTENRPFWWRFLTTLFFNFIFLKFYFSYCEILSAKSKHDKNKSSLLLNIQIHKKKNLKRKPVVSKVFFSKVWRCQERFHRYSDLYRAPYEASSSVSLFIRFNFEISRGSFISLLISREDLINWEVSIIDFVWKRKVVFYRFSMKKTKVWSRALWK